MSGAAQCDFVIDQNADFFVEIYWTSYDNIAIPVVSPIRMQMRSPTGQMVAELLYDTEIDGQTPPTITFNTDSGLIQLQLPASKTNTIPTGIYAYDLFVTYTDAQNNYTLRRHRLLYGQVEVRGKVTLNV